MIGVSERSFKRIKCAETDVPVSRSVMEIERMLAAFGARRIFKDYDGAGQPIGLAFIISTEHGDMPVKMPAEVQSVRQVLREHVRDKLLTRRFNEDPWAKDQAARIAWRVLHDWLYAQLTIVKVQMTKPEQIFLPYIYSEKLGKTVFQVFEEQKFRGMLNSAEEDRP